MFTQLPSCRVSLTVAAMLAVVCLVGANADPANADPGRPITRDPIPVCAVEDASSGPVPCVWIANLIGNQEGRSFRVYRAIDPATGDHRFKYISHNRAFELAGECDSNGPIYCRVTR